MKNPLVSVIIPNYCHAKYLDQRIKSVLNQTYTNFEVIILDDCSPDGGESKAVIEKYRNDKHILHIEYNEHNSGSTFKQWYKGFCLARGELIWIAESDDYCESILLEMCVDKFQLYPGLAMVHTTSIMVKEDGIAMSLKDTSENIPEGYLKGEDFIVKYMTTENAIWNASAVVFRKEYALRANKIYMDYKAAGDHLFWVLLAEQGGYYHTSIHLSYFRHHAIKVTPGKYKHGITHIEEFNTIQYILNHFADAYDDIQLIYNSYIPQILYYEYDSNEIRRNLKKLWRNANPKAYRHAVARSYVNRICNCIKRIFNE